ncbi:MAG: hypothetical protein IK038_09570 [Bacteroidaceae bacterium]|nr:hypothetical protein [Bacteroidaceae bacterium]
MKKKEIIKAINESNIPEDQKQEILKRIQNKTNPEKIVQIIIDFLNLGINFLDKFPP